MDETDVVLAVNHGPATVTWEYNSRKYRLKPARGPQDGIAVPWYAAEMYLGDASLRNIEGGDQHRTNRARRLAVKHGLMDKPWYTDDPNMTTAEVTDQDGVPIHAYTPSVPGPGEDGHGYSPTPAIAGEYRYRHPNLPFVTLHVLASPDNERIWTLADDPWAEADDLEAEFNAAESAASVDAIKALTAQVDFLMARLAQSDPESVAGLVQGKAAGLAGRFAAADVDTPAPVADPSKINALDESVAGAFLAAQQEADRDKSIDEELARGDDGFGSSELTDDDLDDDDTAIPVKKVAKKAAPRRPGS